MQTSLPTLGFLVIGRRCPHENRVRSTDKNMKHMSWFRLCGRNRDTTARPPLLCALGGVETLALHAHAHVRVSWAPQRSLGSSRELGPDFGNGVRVAGNLPLDLKSVPGPCPQPLGALGPVVRSCSGKYLAQAGF